MKLAIVGAAQIVSQYHIHALNAIPSVVITSVIDLISTCKASSNACDASFSVELHDIKDAKVVFIATPPKPREYVLTNLPKSVEYVIIEKPAGLTIQDISKLQEISKNRGIRIAVAYEALFPNLRLCLDLLDSGFLGDAESNNV